MLKFLSKVKIEFNVLDPRIAHSFEFLSLCSGRKARESNPACQIEVTRHPENRPPQITATFLNGMELAFDAVETHSESIAAMIVEKGKHFETEEMFKEAGETWPVIIPDEELRQPMGGIKPRKVEEKK